MRKQSRLVRILLHPRMMQLIALCGGLLCAYALIVRHASGLGF